MTGLLDICSFVRDQSPSSFPCAMETPAPNLVPPLFRAVASSTRPLFQLLRCINFTNKIHVEITADGIRFTADQARVMQGKLSTAQSDAELEE